jgi:Transposase DDE domain group 1
MSRWENAPSLREVIRLMRAMVELYCASCPRPPGSVTLDIDDTVDVVHGRQQLSLFNAHYDERCFLPMHVYDTATARPVMVLLRPGKTPFGPGDPGPSAPPVRQIRRHWPKTRITLRGDSHYGRPELMAWCEAEGINYVFGLPTNAVLLAAVEETADDVRVRRAEAQAPALRRYAETRYAAKSWSGERRVVARIEARLWASTFRFVVTSFARGSAEWVYDGLYCARGQAENLVKLHKTQLPPTAPHAVRPWPTRSAWCCTPPPTGCC